MKSILVIIDYFGGFPEWFEIFLESCRWNPTIQWLIHSDRDYPLDGIGNVEIRRVTWPEYIQRVSDSLGIRFAPGGHYKLCDVRPAYGLIYSEEIRGYDYYGYGDLDVIYGNIRKFYTDEVLRNDLISTHGLFLSGHFALIRNEAWLRTAFTEVPDWREILERADNLRFDEDAFSWVFMKGRYSFGGSNIYWKEQFTTPLIPYPWHDGNLRHPESWYWKDGRITNDRDRGREFIYLHLMNFVSARFIHPLYETRTPWTGLSNVVRIEREQIGRGVAIDRSGFRAMLPSEDAYVLRYSVAGK